MPLPSSAVTSGSSPPAGCPELALLSWVALTPVIMLRYIPAKPAGTSGTKMA